MLRPKGSTSGVRWCGSIVFNRQSVLSTWPFDHIDLRVSRPRWFLIKALVFRVSAARSRLNKTEDGMIRGVTDEQRPWPVEIRLSKDRKKLSVLYDDSVGFELSAEYLRVLSPSAEVQGHSRDQRVTVPGKIAVSITAVDPVGNYAVRLTFSDGHNTGIFSWSYLRRLGEEHDALWAEYVGELAAKGLGRSL
jgi:DUF971 family protein